MDYKSENQEPQVDPVQYEPVPLSETVDKKRAAFDSDESSENGSDESKLTQKSEYSQHAYDAISSTDTSKSNEKLTDSGKNYQEEFSRKPFESESQSDEA